MSYRPSYNHGDWKADCDECGRTFKASQLKKRWDGLMVCSTDWEPRHPQDFVRAKADYQAVPWTRPEPIDSFVSIPYTTLWNDYIPPSDIAKLTFGKNLTETLNTTDSISTKGVGKTISDTVTFTDSLSYFYISNTPVNGASVNSLMVG